MQFLGAALTNSLGVDAFGVEWTPSLKTGAYTAVHRDWIHANTTSAAFTVTLPASPALGAVVRITDAAKTFGTNAVTVGRNGQTIDGTAADYAMNVAGWDVVFYFNGVTWRPMGSGIKRVQKGTATVSAGNPTGYVDVTITPVNTTKCSFQIVGDFLNGRPCTYAFQSATTLRITRLAGNDLAADVGWELVEFW